MSNENADSIKLRAIAEAGAHYGKSDTGAGKRVLVEFVSAQPNAILTVTHGRGGVLGDTIAALLAATGHDVEREFYVNDAQDSRPMRAFARAVLALYRLRCGLPDATPETDSYNSDYIATIADRIYNDVGDVHASAPTSAAVPVFLRLAFALTQKDQRDVLELLQIRFDHWTSESELARHGAVVEAFDSLSEAGRVENRGGALWLSAAAFGEPHDYVLRRADGSATYLAGDLAYHRGKFERGYDHMVDVWNADHATYVSRTRAGVEAMGYDPDRLGFVVFQRVRVLKDGTEIKGSRDNAQAAVSLAEVINEIGADETRFQLSIEDPSELLDLNIDARSLQRKNSLGRVRRAIHDARARSVDKTAVHHLHSTERDAIIRASIQMIETFPSVVARAAANFAPHLIARYAVDLATNLETVAALNATDPIFYSAGAVALENALVLLGISPGPSVTERNL